MILHRDLNGLGKLAGILQTDILHSVTQFSPHYPIKLIAMKLRGCSPGHGWHEHFRMLFVKNLKQLKELVPIISDLTIPIGQPIEIGLKSSVIFFSGLA